MIFPSDYVGEFIYENSSLQFIHHEEGRIIQELNDSFTYQYHLKDHLGNTRATFTSGHYTSRYTATMEDAMHTQESADFFNLDPRVPHPYPDAPSTKAVRLNSSSPIGPGLGLAVSRGDTIDISFKAYYEDLSGHGTSSLGAAAMAAALTTAYGGVNGGSEGQQLLYDVFNDHAGAAVAAGGTGASIGLSGSESGIDYQLKRDGSNVGAAVPGTGSALDFGLHTVAGSYTVEAANATSSCAVTMSGSASVSIDALPTAYNVSGGGSYCDGGTGVTIGLSGSDTGIDYQLKRDGSNVGGPVAGTGSALDFGLHTVAGSYTVEAANASSSCAVTMSGSASVSIDALPTAYNVSGGGSYCDGGTGASIGLSGSESGIDYQLKRDGSNVGSPVSGTGSALDFGLHTLAGNYTVEAANASSSCAVTMSGSASVSIDPLPTAYNVSGGGSYCTGESGVSLGLSGSESGIDYQLKRDGSNVGAAVPGTGSALDFGLHTVAGSYTVEAANATSSCAVTMSGSASVSIDALPTAYNVSGGGSYCDGGTGVTIGLSGSDTGIDYQLKRDGSNVGAAVPGTGSALDFGLHTAVGNYTVEATNSSSSCGTTMTGSASVSIDPLPTAYNVSGGGSYCTGESGVSLGLSGSESGVDYQLKRDGSNVGAAVPGTGSALDFGLHTVAGNYTVEATNSSSSCGATMTGSVAVSIDPLPTAYNVSGGGSYCTGESGVSLGLSGSESGVDYQLKRDGSNVGAAVPGTGSALDFGLHTVAGSYTVEASNASSSCAVTMSGSASVSIDALPTAHAVTGGGSYCTGESGVSLGLSGSESGVDYQLKRDGSNVGAAVPGTGSALDFGLHTVAGSYTVEAFNASSSCAVTMSGSASVSIDALPTAHAVTGGGSYCTGESGVSLGLSGSESGVDYQLKRDGSNVGAEVSGTGSALDFGLHTVAGNYTVEATNSSSSCGATMTGSVAVSIDPLPTAYNVSGGGSYCTGESGVSLGLSGSESGVDYQLKRDGSNVGAVVPGTGSALDFGLHTAAGSYTVEAANASSSCAVTMSGSASVSIDPLPTAHAVTGGGSYCTGESGVSLGLSGSESGVDYQLKRDGSNVGVAVPGTGSALDFGLHTAVGNYTVEATNSSSSCGTTMTGSASVSIDALPTAHAVTGGGSYCTGESGVSLGLSGSESGVDYQLKRDGSNVGAVVPGTGSALDFGLHTAAGSYTVEAANASSSCAVTMSGSASVSIDPLPTAYNVSGGGSYCTGESGVSLGLSGSESGVDYQLKRDGSNVGVAVPGTGSALDFGLHTAVGNYTVEATNSSSSCGTTMTGSASVSIDALPTAHAVTGGGSYCTGESGVSLGLSGSESGVDYQLKRDGSNVGAVVPGTGSALDFGLHTAAGNYTVEATNSSSSCGATMTGSVAVSIDALPTAHSVTGGGSYCDGGTGVTLGLSGSESGVDYQLKRDGSNVGVAVPGTGSALDFGLHTAAGNYTIEAADASSSCAVTMSGSASVSIDALPTAHAVTGGGSYCTGESGVTIGLSGSESGVDYQLKRDGSNVGAAVPGTGSALDFGLHTLAGNYTVEATNSSSSCGATMTGSVAVSIDALPTAHAVTGGGSYCTGESGVSLGLSGSESGVDYQLKRDGSNVGSPVPGTGSALDFGLHTAAGSYTVEAANASSSCAVTMSGSASVSIDPLPTAYNVSGGGSYCDGGTGVTIGLSGSETGIDYQLKRDGSNVGAAVSGTGSALDFGLHTVVDNNYTVVAINTSTNCSTGMNGSVNVSLYPVFDAGAISGAQTLCASDDPLILSNVTQASGGDGVYNYQWQSKVDPGSWTDIVGATSDSYDPDPLTTTTSYRRGVTACSGQQLYSNEIQITVFQKPTAPNVVGQTYGYLGASVELDEPPIGETRYWQNSALDTSEANEASSFLIDTPDTYYVRSKNEDGCWSDGNAQFTMIASEPSGISISAQSHETLLVSWTPISGSESGFVVSRATATNGAYINVHVAGGQDTEYLDENLSAETTFYYRVQSLEAGQTSAALQVSSASTLDDPGDDIEVAHSPAYNGNISAIRWKTVVEEEEQIYTYGYDSQDRLTKAIYASQVAGVYANNQGHFSVPSVAYDLNGNIKRLKRIGRDDEIVDDLIYSYVQGNRLNSVEDTNGNLEGFKDGSSGGEEYEYDANGNMVKDLNKGIDSIYYNYLSLIQKIDMGGGDSTLYTYNAEGVKLQEKNFQGGVLVKTIDFVNGFVYEDNVLQFIQHEEGKVVPKEDEPGYDYQYQLKDHLGNIRLTFTTAQYETDYLATMETDKYEDEIIDFYNIDNTVPYPPGGRAVRLNSTNPIGPAIGLEVAVGDTVAMSVKSYYEDASGHGTSPLAAEALAAALTSALGGLDGGTEGAQQLIYDVFNAPEVIGAIVSGDDRDDDMPGGYLNYMLFDKDFAYVDAGFFPVEQEPMLEQTRTVENIVIEQAGYIYIYVSNESNTGNHIYFDDLNVAVSESPILSSSDYSPFGLSFNNYKRYHLESEASYAAGGLGWKDLGFRQYDPALGRFHSTDPLAELQLRESTYQYAGNNPTNNIDVLGLFGNGKNGGKKRRRKKSSSDVPTNGSNQRVGHMDVTTGSYGKGSKPPKPPKPPKPTAEQKKEEKEKRKEERKKQKEEEKSKEKKTGRSQAEKDRINKEIDELIESAFADRNNEGNEQPFTVELNEVSRVEPPSLSLSTGYSPTFQSIPVIGQQLDEKDETPLLVSEVYEDIRNGVDLDRLRPKLALLPSRVKYSLQALALAMDEKFRPEARSLKARQDAIKKQEEEKLAKENAEQQRKKEATEDMLAAIKKALEDGEEEVDITDIIKNQFGNDKYNDGDIYQDSYEGGVDVGEKDFDVKVDSKELTLGDNDEDWNKYKVDLKDIDKSSSNNKTIYTFNHRDDSDKPLINVEVSDEDKDDFEKEMGIKSIDRMLEKEGPFTSEEFKEARELIEEETDEDKKKEYFRQLRPKVRYVNQRSLDSEGKALEAQLRGYSKLRSVMCQFTSISRELEYLGIENPDPSKEFADAMEDIRQEDYPLPVEGDDGYNLPENLTDEAREEFFDDLLEEDNMRTQHGLWEDLLDEKFGVEIKSVVTNMSATKENFESIIGPYLDSGYGVITTIGSHIITIQAITDDVLVVDDPNGTLLKEGETTNLIKKRNDDGDVYSQYNVRNSDSSSSNLGENNEYKWEDLTEVSLVYIKVLSKK